MGVERWGGVGGMGGCGAYDLGMKASLKDRYLANI